MQKTSIKCYTSPDIPEYCACNYCATDSPREVEKQKHMQRIQFFFGTMFKFKDLICKTVAPLVLLQQFLGQVLCTPEADVLVLVNTAMFLLMAKLSKTEMCSFLPPQSNPEREIFSLCADVVQTLSAVMLQAIAEHQNTDVEFGREVLHVVLRAPVAQ